MNSITQRMKYKQSVVKFSFKYGVRNASIKFNECERTIYRWRKRYNGNVESLADKSRKPQHFPFYFEFPRNSLIIIAYTSKKSRRNRINKKI